ncbi:PREDICTED: ninja-family protein AFP1-like isoform X3 [Lupinus angustifolius]|uniref:ninja-family protein AFP1-like isoform X2 n=1 Tax=Lupinus angustifolius TaxID=3871 RepID=UPI00092FC22C|nr:PREDICTED: ninja-family protein AFP1-like isoform X2 [Lupinus angustifolius]XP_019462268.1 PREDICTED: ninja-family protein AFP1-like isoform X3 [Lupinus angustifolius]
MDKGKYPRDLLQIFNMSSTTSRGVGVSDDHNHNHQQHQHQNFYHQQLLEEENGEEDKEEVELNLGLSLGGKFGVDKYAAYKSNKLMRSSSVVGTMPLFREGEGAVSRSLMMATPHPLLMRTSSLPVETEEELRKRKELQTLRRMEAKRRRSEKRISKPEREGSAGAGGGGGLEEVEGSSAAVATTVGLNRFGGSGNVGPPPWGMVAKQVVLGDVLGKGKIGGAGFQGLFAQPSSQGSVDSQGGSSSSGPSSCGETRSPASNQSLQERRSGHDAVGSSSTKTNENITKTSGVAEMENPSKRPLPPAQNTGREIGTNSMEDMPCVFTKGNGPNGRRVEGILYKYGKGEEVTIMCVCHGKFLSPSEFVKHAGGGDVANPHRHIVINPSAAPFV